MKRTYYLLRHIAIAAILGIVLTGCKTPQDVTYFQDVTQTVVPVSSEKGQIKIEPFDKLSIVIKSKDPALSELFNLTVNTMRVGQSANIQGGSIHTRTYVGGYEGMSNYTVNQAGDIDFPVLGNIHVSGMTRGELAEFIKGDLIGKNLVKDPVVSVEFINMGFYPHDSH